MINDFFNILLPQACLVVFILLELILAIFLPKEKYHLSRSVSITGLSLTILLLSVVQTEPQYFAFSNSIMSDSYTLLFHFVILVCGFCVALLSKNILEVIKEKAFVYHSLLMTAILGAMNTISSNDFITLLISIEMLSFATYFLIASAKGYFSKEASFKYLITTAVSTGVYLFGASYLYGLTSSLNFSEIYEFVAEQETSLLYWRKDGN